MQRLWFAARFAASALVLGTLAAGCTVHTVEPVGYVETTSGPVYYDAYPSTVYDGHVVYFVNDRWMYRDRGAWVYYRSEPPALYRHRTYVQQAPVAAPRAYRPAYPSAGRSYQPARPSVAAPPARAPSAAPRIAPGPRISAPRAR